MAGSLNYNKNRKVNRVLGLKGFKAPLWEFPVKLGGRVILESLG